MPKKRVTKAQRAYAKRYNKRRQYYEGKTYKVFKNIFIDFGEKVSKAIKDKKKFAEFATTEKDIIPYINYDYLEKKVKYGLEVTAQKTIPGMSVWINRDQKWNLTPKQIPSITSKSYKRYKKKIGKKVTSITETTRKQISSIVQDGLEKGWKVDEIAEAIQTKTVQMSKGRAHRIAFTEAEITTSISNEETAKEAQMNKKTWLHTNIAKEPRAAHQLLDGMTLKMDQLFNVNGFDAWGPHDDSLPPEEVIYCSCLLTFS